MSLKRKAVEFKDAKKILESVYPELARRVVPNLNDVKTNLLRKNLGSNDPRKVIRSTLTPLDGCEDENDLGLATRKKRFPLSQALESLPKRRNGGVLSNLLLFRSRNQLLDVSDFKKLAPKERSLFDLSSLPNGTYDFTIRGGRTSNNLEPRAGYYLIFKTKEEAAAFSVDTLGKQLNGVNFHTEMLEARHHLGNICLSAFNETCTLKDDVLILTGGFPRNQCVLVKGFPNFVTQNTLIKMLYDYDLHDGHDAITPVNIDHHARVGEWLIKFQNPTEALRFSRNFHGFHLNNKIEFPKIYVEMIN